MIKPLLPIISFAMGACAVAYIWKTGNFLPASVTIPVLIAAIILPWIVNAVAKRRKTLNAWKVAFITFVLAMFVLPMHIGIAVLFMVIGAKGMGHVFGPEPLLAVTSAFSLVFFAYCAGNFFRNAMMIGKKHL
jgi:hypothetical protein